jgi:VWFA-related protein
LKKLSPILALLLLVQPSFPQEGGLTIKTTVNIVVLNVSVKGPDGKPIENLTKDDFQIYEDGKLQRLASADLERLGTTPLPAAESAPAAASAASRPAIAPKPAPTTPPAQAAGDNRYQDRRLIVMLFDFSSLQPLDQTRAVEAARKFVATQLTASDLVAVMVFASQLRVVQDFTADRERLLATINGFHIGEGSELAGMADTGADAEDQSGMFVADDTEFNIFNTDRKLEALAEAARQLSQYPQKKALVYFSGGVEKTGVENQSQLRATVNAAVRSNVAFYPIDARGLMAAAPGGDATQAGAVGSSLFSGRGQRSRSDSFQNQQETLDTLAADTGGKALLDSNDLTLGIRQVQQDIDSYYVLVYESSNPAEDGKYRRVQVKLVSHAADLKAKLDYRQGYFAPVKFAQMTGGDKESQLQQALVTQNALTDLPLAVETDYFRLAKGKYFVPIAVRIPGSALQFRQRGSKSATEMDFIAEVRDARGQMAATVRDTIPLKLDQSIAGAVARKQVQYDTGVTLGPGEYKLKFVARENGEGKVGTFEDAFTVPNLEAESGLRVSSVILSNQRQPLAQRIAAASNDKKLAAQNPLVDEAGNQILPNVTRAFRAGQTLYAFLQVYDPGAPEGAAPNARPARVSASLGIYSDDRKVAESAPVRVMQLNGQMPGQVNGRMTDPASGRANGRGDRQTNLQLSQRSENAVPLLLQLPLRDLAPGRYACQVNVIDEFGKKFAFLRNPLVILAPETTTAAELSHSPPP